MSYFGRDECNLKVGLASSSNLVKNDVPSIDSQINSMDDDDNGVENDDQIFVLLI